MSGTRRVMPRSPANQLSYTHTLKSAGNTKNMGNHHRAKPKSWESILQRRSGNKSCAHTKAQACCPCRPEATCRHSRWWHVPCKATATLCGGRPTTGRRHSQQMLLPNVLPPSTAAWRATTASGGMCHASAGERAATLLLEFTLRGSHF
jgi:hypothetical protein